MEDPVHLPFVRHAISLAAEKKKEKKFRMFVEHGRKREITLNPKFKTQLDGETFKAKLESTWCLVTFKITKEFSKSVNMKSWIYVKKSCLTSMDSFNTRMKKRKVSKSLNPFKLLKRSSKAIIEDDMSNHEIKPFGEASLIWSCSNWKSWDSVRAEYLRQTRDYLIYEVNLTGVQRHMASEKIIEFVACYQNDNGIVKDTNEDECYVFELSDTLVESDEE